MKKTRILACLCAFLLAVQLVPAAAFAQRAASDNGRIPIEELLAGGDYVDGEAIAIVRVGAGVDVAGQVEEITEVSADSVRLAASGALNSESAIDDEVAQRVQSIRADSYTIKHIVDHGRTTEQILRDLYDDPDVVSAEPNYLIQNPASLDDQDKAAESNGLALGAGSTPLINTQAADDNSKDLTFNQWSLDDAMSAYGYNTAPRSPTGSYSMNVPGWVDNRYDGAAPNATTGTVCIMDTGIDTTHPDLMPVLFDFSDPNNFPADRYAELQAKYGLGKYGMNASGDKDPGVDGYDSHGTHVAGIVAAQWNDFGISGVANGTKIFSVRIFGPADTQNEAALLRGFEFLVEVAREVNLKAVNCSWGTGVTQFSYEVMVNELGKKGVNVVYASGNRYANLDETTDVGVNNSPYSITVNAAQPDGKMTDFSCYGQAATDVFAPGTQIMSTISRMVRWEYGSETTSRNIFMRFFPEATDASNLLAYAQFTDGSTNGVRLFKENPATSDEAQEITDFIDSGNGYGDKFSAGVNVSSLHKAKEEPVLFNGSSGYVYAAIPLNAGASVNDVKHVAVNLAMSDSFKPVGGIASITCNIEGESKPDEVDTTASKTFLFDGTTWYDGKSSGWISSATYNTYLCQWSAYSFNVEEFIRYSNHAHEWLKNNPGEPLPGERTETGGYGNYHDPGKATGVYGWQPDGASGKTYVIVKVALSAHGVEPSESTTLYIDNLAVGTSNAYFASYEIMAGTSMAAPAVTGCLAVIAKGERPNSEMTDAELEQAALERASKLLASVDYDDDLSKLCRTGGRVDLKRQSSFTKKAPIITSAVADGDALTVSGYFFGTSGTLAIDDIEVPAANITGWSDSSITASLSDRGLANGSHVAKVTNSDGAIMRMTFSYSSTQATGRPLYERTHSVPINDAQFIEAKSDRLYGSMVYCDGSLFALTAEGSRRVGQNLWRYDTQTDMWSRCADFPAGCKGSELTNDRLVAYKGSVYMKTATLTYKGGRDVVWKYDISGDTWTEVVLANGRSWPGGPLCALGEDLLIVGVSEYQFNPASGDGDEEGETEEAKTSRLYAAEGEGQGGDSGEASNEEPSTTKYYCARVDLDAGTLTKIEGAFEDDFASIDYAHQKTATSANKIYLYAPKDKENQDDKVDADWLARLTYDKASNTMTYENLRPQLVEAIGNDLIPEFDKKSGAQNNSTYITLAGLPDGVAIVGSSTLGEDTHIIKNDSTEVLAYDRTSSYHHAFEPLAAWGDDGYLYATGTNATEPDIMYFRSTYYGKTDPVDPGGDSGNTKEPLAKTGASAKTGDLLQWEVFVFVAIAALAVAVFCLRKRRGQG